MPHSPIRHIFLLVKENHAFENYFGTFPGTIGNPPNGSLPVGFNSTETVQPFALAGNSTPDLPHDRNSDLVDLDGGRNDLFVAQAASLGYTAPQDAVGFYRAQQIPDYFAYAHAYVLADRFFSGVLGPTLPNRLFDLGLTDSNWTSDGIPPPSAVAGLTILNELSVAGVSWVYLYSEPRTNVPPLLVPAIYSNPCLVRSILPVDDLSGLLNASEPPAVVYIDPSHDRTYSEHPPASVTVGEDWTAAVINTIFQSRIGSSSAIFLFWDENGGFWDPVAPPNRSGLGDGFRVPLLVMSPWSPAGSIVHTVIDSASLLRFIDTNWGLSYLNERVAQAAPLDGFFNYSLAPRASLILPTPVSFPATSSPVSISHTTVTSGTNSTPGPPTNALARLEPTWFGAHTDGIGRNVLIRPRPPQPSRLTARKGR